MVIPEYKNVIVTGGSGFLGRHIIESLLERKVNVISVVRNVNSLSYPLQLPLENYIEIPDLFQCTENDFKYYFDKIDNIDMMIHAAWYTKNGSYLNSIENINCLFGSINLAKYLLKTSCTRFVGIGTCFEYDLSARVLSTSTPLSPGSLYAACKIGTFQTLDQLFLLSKINFVWCRLFYLYGPGENENRLVPYIRNQIKNNLPVKLTSGLQIRDFLDVRVAAAKIVELSFGEQIGATNICSGIPITVRQLAENVADEFGRRDLLQFGSRPDNLIDPPCVLGI